ncbi:GNAT family N-acetyltransferase [uncultured Enterovirga sp.]|uniref:GNAT family N-acetyltransferase n=1 Tax=uncultured Enterovirga sp. TaxID=2026352 RepID=UPI0035CC3081
MREPHVATTVRTWQELEALASDWWDLWRRCPTATPFTSPAWLLAWWHSFEPGSLRTVAVRESGRLVGLAPFYLEDGPLGRRLLPLGIGLSDLFDLLLDPASEGVAEAILEAMAAEPDWTSWHLEELPEGAAALTLPCPAGCTDQVAAQSARPVLDLPDNRIDALATLPSAKRRKLRMAGHRVARRGGIVETVRAEDVPGFLADLIRLHGARWTAREEAGVLADDRVRRFHDASLPALAEAGLARLYRLVIEGQVAGAYYGLRHGPAAYAYLGGFDPDFSFESPGTILLGHAIEAAAQEGAVRFDLLRGREPYKYEWGAADRWNQLRVIRRAGPHG